MHARDQIATAFIDALSMIAGITTTKGQLFSVYDSQLPLQTVYATEEEIEIDNNQGRLTGLQRRTARITVQCYLKAEDNLESGLDDMAVNIEETIFADPVLKNLVRCLDLVSTLKETSKEGETEVGIISLTFSCRYMTEDGQPQVII